MVSHITLPRAPHCISPAAENYFSLLTLNTTVCVWNTAHLSGTHRIWIVSVNPFHFLGCCNIFSCGYWNEVQHLVLATSLLNCSLWEQQAVPLLKDAERFCAEQHPIGVGSLHWGPQAVQNEGVRAILVKHSLIKTAQATQLTNQYVVIWSTLLRGFWTFINKIKQR